MFPKSSRIQNTFLFDPIFVFLMIFGGWIRFYGLDRALGTKTLGGFDEGVDFRHYIYTSFEYIFRTYYVSGVPPGLSHHVFNTLLTRLMLVIFGEENEIALRFPVFLFGLACLILIYKGSLEIFASRKIARIALMIGVICPVHITYSQTIRGYSLVMFFSIALIIVAIKLLELEKNIRWAFLFVICGFLSLYTIPTNLHFLLGLYVWMGWIFIWPTYCQEFNIFPA